MALIFVTKLQQEDSPMAKTLLILSVFLRSPLINLTFYLISLHNKLIKPGIMCCKILSGTSSLCSRYVMSMYTCCFVCILNTETCVQQNFFKNDQININQLWITGRLLGFANYTPPFATARGREILQGVNYGSGGSGIRDETGRNLVIEYILLIYQHAQSYLQSSMNRLTYLTIPLFCTYILTGRPY